jgi:3-hydroxyisobutyrate dehydrogenase-like beta-hydroxyacid dehydrogenase
MSDVSEIGLGVMGSVLARILLQDGYTVTAWNRCSNKALTALVELPGNR